MLGVATCTQPQIGSPYPRQGLSKLGVLQADEWQNVWEEERMDALMVS